MNLKLVLIICSLFLVGCNTSSKKEKKIMKETVEKIQEQKPQEISTIKPLPKEVNLTINITERMIFNKKELRVQAGQKVNLVVTNTSKIKKDVMWHNWVLLKQGVSISKFANKAAKDKNYSLKSDEVIISTKKLEGGQIEKLTFIAPKKGTYNFICTFPGHYFTMKGKLIVS